MKAYKAIHVTVNVVAFVALGVFLIYFLLSYGGLPEKIGVHFSPMNGSFDVYEHKIFGFYPFVAGFAMLGIFSLLTLAVGRIKRLGAKVTDEGDRVLRCAATLMLDVMKLTWSVFFSYWTICVVHQTGMGNGGFLLLFRLFFICILMLTPIVFTVISSRYRTEPDENEAAIAEMRFQRKIKTNRLKHFSANLIAFVLLGLFLLFFLLSYERLPERIGVHFGHDGRFDVRAAKVFGFYPFVAGFGLLGIFSLLTLAVNKVKKLGLKVNEHGDKLIRCAAVEALDIMKLVWSMFFSLWSYSVIKQVALNLGIVSILITVFVALLPITVVVIAVTAIKYKAQPHDSSQVK